MAYYLQLVYRPHAVRHFNFKGDVTNAGAFGLSAGMHLTKQMPSMAVAQKNYKNFPDVFPMPGVNCVNARFRDLVESFEPNTHQFFPIELQQNDGKKIEEDFFIFNCVVSFDAVFAKESGAKWLVNQSGMPYISLDLDEDWLLSKEAIGDHHLWCGGRIDYGSGLFVSDSFQRELNNSDIKYLKMKFCSEIDQSWIAEDNVQRQMDWEKENPGLIHEDSTLAALIRGRGKIAPLCDHSGDQS